MTVKYEENIMSIWLSINKGATRVGPNMNPNLIDPTQPTLGVRLGLSMFCLGAGLVQNQI